jgi:hypothetical protein
VLRRQINRKLAGRIVGAALIAGLVTYLIMVGLPNADMIGSAVACVLAFAALLAPYLFPPRPGAARDTVRAYGPGSVAVGGDNSGDIRSGVTGVDFAVAGGAVAGIGSVVVGGTNHGLIHTDVRGREERRHGT